MVQNLAQNQPALVEAGGCERLLRPLPLPVAASAAISAPGLHLCRGGRAVLGRVLGRLSVGLSGTERAGRPRSAADRDAGRSGPDAASVVLRRGGGAGPGSCDAAHRARNAADHRKTVRRRRDRGPQRGAAVAGGAARTRHPQHRPRRRVPAGAFAGIPDRASDRRRSDEAGARAEVRGDSIALRLGQESQRIEILSNTLVDVAVLAPARRSRARPRSCAARLETAEGGLTQKVEGLSQAMNEAALRASDTLAVRGLPR